MSSTKLAGIVAGLSLAFVAVAGGGFYLGQHYRLVPIEPPQPPVFQPPDSVSSAPAVTAAPQTPQPPVPPSLPETIAETVVPKGEGPFSYRFNPGEKLGYMLFAEVSGAGNERDLGMGDMGMRFDAQFDLDTETVDQEGVANLKLQFNRADLVGRFMGDEVSLHHGGTEGESPQLANQVRRSKARLNSSVSPELEFFKQPIRMSVAPNGEVLGVQGMPGIEEMLVPESIVAAVGFPETMLAEGQQWESSFRLPIPGFDVAADAKAINSFEGYTDLGGHPCAVIRQVLDSSQVNGQLSSATGVLGEMMKFSMPKFSLAGENMIYFDTQLGKVRRADIDLTVGIVIGEELGAFKNLITAFGEQLDGLEGGSPGKSSAKVKSSKPDEPEKPLLDLGFNVVSTLTLQDTESLQP